MARYLAASIVSLVMTTLLACTERPVGSGERAEATRSLAAFTLGEFTSADILLVVDDSASMADKQRLLAELFSAVLEDDACAPVEGDAAMGSVMECRNRLPADAHLGVITTSLALGNASTCPEGDGLLVPTPDGAPFLVLEDLIFPPYATEKAARLEQWFTGVGQEGCGYEAPLEAAYRFLVEPEPLKRPRADESAPSTIDTTVLEQRDAFLRPDSLVFVVILSDEDDCSLMDSPEGIRMASPDPLAAASSALGDHPNVRCYEPETRFGFDGRYPTSRYVEGFSSSTLSEGRPTPVRNPLFADHRGREAVRLLGIVGAPWQFVADEETLDDPSALRVLTADELASEGRWPLLLADNGVGPDPHLSPSLLPRPGLATPDSPLNADPIHGHEYDNPALSDLQYSCVFPLSEPRDCSDVEDSCDCAWEPDSSGVLAPTSPNRPLCQAPDDTYGQVQYFGKAYPPPRLLEVLRGVGGTVGSVCPKTTDPAHAASTAFGYTAAFRALTEDVSGAFGVSCLDGPLPMEDGQIKGCKVVEVVSVEQGCDVRGRVVADEAHASVARSLLFEGEQDAYAFCELLPVEGDPREPGSPAYSCAHDLEADSDAYGYCYIDPSNGLGSDALVERCAGNVGRRVRLVPYGIGRPGPTGKSTLRLVCL